MHRKPLFIYGAGGLGREVLALIRQLPEWEVKGFFDDHLKTNLMIKGVPVLGNGMAIPANSSVIFAIGDPSVKRRITQQIDVPIESPVIIHPSAIVMDRESVAIGPGTIISAGVVLTCDITIGRHVLINLNCTVGHDTRIGSYSSVMPGCNIAGEVVIGEDVLLGSDANVMNRISIGRNAKIGMGTVVMRHVDEYTTVVGVPGREVIRHNPNSELI